MNFCSVKRNSDRAKCSLNKFVDFFNGYSRETFSRKLKIKENVKNFQLKTFFLGKYLNNWNAILRILPHEFQRCL